MKCPALISLLFALVTREVLCDPNPAYVCSFCAITLGLVEQVAFQIKLEDYLTTKCNSVAICEYAVKKFINKLEDKVSPDVLCKEMSLCPEQCTLYTEWPVSLPPEPIPWNVERKLTYNDEKSMNDVSLSELKPIFMDLASVMPSSRSDENGIHLLGHAVFALAAFAREVKAFNTRNYMLDEYEPCGFNLTCHITDLVDHISVQDHDGDRYSIAEFMKLRGSDWRGSDCNDTSSSVYPGRKLSSDRSGDIDHNCNGIYGSNETGLYEDLFCSGEYEPRGLVMLGDSATAHFHIPPQWVSAVWDEAYPKFFLSMHQLNCYEHTYR